MRAAIQLTDYYVTSIDFKYTKASSTIEEKGLKFGHSIEYRGTDEVKIEIQCSISDESGLELSVVLVGLFDIQWEQHDEEWELPEDIRMLCEKNTLSILFPYLRSTISDISLKANIDPVILPTINIAALLERKKELIED